MGTPADRLRQLASEYMGRGLAGGDTVAGAQLSGQLAGARQAQARMELGSPAQSRAAFLGSAPAVVSGSLPLAAQAGQEQWGRAGRGVDLYGRLRESDIAAAARWQAEEAAKARARQANYNANRGLVGNIFGGLATGLLIRSDERAKTGAMHAPEDADAFLDSLTPQRYAYRGESRGAEPHLGVMAQDLEETPAGAAAVARDGDGMRMVDTEAILPAILRAMTRVEERLGRLEGGGMGGMGGGGRQMEGMR